MFKVEGLVLCCSVCELATVLVSGLFAKENGNGVRIGTDVTVMWANG